MGIDKGWMAGSTAMLLLRLLEERDRYGYQMIEELRRRSDHTFDLKAGTLYPLLHGLEEKGWITSYQGEGGGRTRKYYHLTEKGRRELKEKRAEWDRYTRAVSRVRGVSLPFTGPGISALRMFMERSVLPESMVMNTSTPMPPTQWVKLRQNSSPWLMASTSVRMEAPVVVKPLTVSKNASA